MAYVQSSRGKKYQLLSTYGDEPTPHIECEGEKFIRDLSIKQLDTKLTLEKQISLHKTFERGSGFVPLSAHNGGSSSLKELIEKVSFEDKLERLQILGLSNKEANAVLNGEDLFFPDSKVETSLKISRANEIKNILHHEVVNNSTNEVTDRKSLISRHEKELALAVKPDSTETKLLQFALSCNAQQSNYEDTRPANHPINQLNEIEKSLFCERDPLELVKTLKRKRLQHLDTCSPMPGPKFMKNQSNGMKKSLWDQEDSNIINKPNDCRIKKYICKKETFYTIKDGKIIEVDNKKLKNDNVTKNEGVKSFDEKLHGKSFVNVSKSLSSEENHPSYPNVLPRLNVEEIKNLPRFKNYEKGKPTNVLYIKNLANNFTENDLVNLFKKYEKANEPSIIFRLLTGKMRGQAFVTFSNEEIATKALDDINGTIFKDKPIVIQFGKISR